nr:ATP-dependent helicase C-terminal domain-containing protein [Serratia fonticola]
MESFVSSLPVSAVLDELLAALQSAPQVLLHAPTGAGKSTWLPLQILAKAGLPGRIIMLEPRRLAAKNVAYRLAQQLGEEPGQTVGYRMRAESKSGPQTRLEVVTEGILTRMLQQDAELQGVSLIILDEFHERSLQADLALALLLDVQQGLRDDLKLLIMSATLDNALPTHYAVPTGSRLPIRYDADKPPVLAVRLQEMFGEQRSPTLAEGRIPVVLELLSPAHRPLQITGDLAAFWQGAYREVQKEMKGRYPKHVWPDDPANTAPTRRTKKYQ